jgi:hypothetical protein
MKKYEIKTDRPIPTQEEVEKGMNMEKVKAKAGTFRKAKTNNAIIGGSIILGLAFLGLFWIKNDSDQPGKEEIALLPSNSNISISYIIEAEKDTSLVYKTGTIINIPAMAFLDEKGNEIKGKIEIKYREFHDLGEILLSAIPMTYDSAGSQYHFESAGMFEINGYKDNKAVFIKNDKTIEVALSSKNDNTTKFNQYYYDTISKNWNYSGEDDVSLLNLKQGEKDDKVMASTSNSNLLKPVKYNPGRYHFTIEVDKEEFPELDVYDKVLFEVSPETGNFDPKSASVQWEDATIERIPGAWGKYKIKFTYGDKEYEVIANAVFEDNNYQVALKKYNELNLLYEAKLNQKEGREAKKEEKMNAEVQTFEKLTQYYMRLERYKQLLASNIGNSEEMVYRTFQVRNFGVWNSDCPASMPQGELVIADFKTMDNKTLDVSSVFLVESGKNALYSLGKTKKISFNPEAENTLIVITKDNSVGWFSKEDFKNITKGSKSYTFKLNIKHKKEYTPSDIVEII